MKLAGQTEIAAPADRVWALINDPVSLAGCVPGVQDVRRIDDKTFGGGITAAVGVLFGLPSGHSPLGNLTLLPR